MKLHIDFRNENKIPERHKYFVSREKAEAFAAEVNGELYPKGHPLYDFELDVTDFPEDYKHFNYVVSYELKE